MKAKAATKEEDAKEDESAKEPIPAPVKKSLIRIMNEYRTLKDLSKRSASFRKFKYSQDSMLKWNAILMPQKEPYNKGSWRIQFQMPPDYPQTPPKIKFLTPIYHPNVSLSGAVKLDILLESKWKENVTMLAIVQSLEYTLENPKTQTKDEKLVLNKNAASNIRCSACTFNRKAKKQAEKEALKRRDAKSKGKSKKDSSDKKSKKDKTSDSSDKSKKDKADGKSDKSKKDKADSKSDKLKTEKKVENKSEKSKK